MLGLFKRQSKERDLKEERRTFLLKERNRLLESGPKIVYQCNLLKIRLNEIDEELGVTKENNLAKFLKDGVEG